MTILDAIKLYDERKKAIGLGSHSVQGEDVIRLLFSGFDLDPDELLSLRPVLLAVPIAAIMEGANVAGVIEGMWVDGLITGLYLARLRGAGD